MPRPKGSKNKPKTVAVDFQSVEQIAEQIVAVEAEIATLSETLKTKKAELKALNKAKDSAEREAAEHRAAEEKAKLLEAVSASGKSIDEIIEMIRQ